MSGVIHRPLRDGAAGSSTPVVLVPNYNDPQVYHGRLEGPRETTFGINKVFDPVTLKFLESRRSL